MSIATSLLNAQRKDDDEAKRVTEAIDRALATDGDTHPAEAYLAATAAVESTYQDIADEKAPVRAAPSEQHLEAFGAPQTSSFDDGEPVQAATHRLDSRYQLDDSAPADTVSPPLETYVEPDNTEAEELPAEELPAEELPAEELPAEELPAEELPAEELPAEELPAEDQDPADEELPASVEEQTDTTPETPPWSGDDGMLSARPPSNFAPPPMPTTAPTAALGGDLLAESDAGDTVPEDLPETFDTQLGDDADPHPDDESENDGLSEELGDLGDSDDLEESSEPDPGLEPDPQSSQDTPRFSWESDAAAAVSPWDDAEELKPAATPTAAASATDAAAIPSGEEASSVSLTPSDEATPPPSEMDEPEPEHAPPVSDRIRDALSSDSLRGKVSDPKRLLKMVGIGFGALVLVIVIALSFMGGGRDTPPDPAVIVAPPPSPADNTTPAVQDVTLVPETVSASCGNDSDSIAPFAGDKTRAWVCNRINGLDLNVLNITFKGPVVITSITIVPGFNYIAPDGRDEWSRHRLVTAVSWRMGGKVYPQNIAPTRTGVTQQFDSVITQQMSMTITGSMTPPIGEGQGDSIDEGETNTIDETTAISTIVITGHMVDPGAG